MQNTIKDSFYVILHHLKGLYLSIMTKNNALKNDQIQK